MIPPLPGLNDYRAILHAHAEDSAHTGGTRPEMLADAKKVGVNAILLCNHFRPPTDFITDSWRGLHDGVLFIPGSEDRGFLLLPTRSIVAHMKEPTPSFIETVKAEGGLIFLSHIEERPDHSMAGLNGMEIYNRHADAKKDAAGLLAIVLKLTHPASLEELEESLAASPMSCSLHRWNIRPITWRSGMPRPKPGGSRASPPTIAIIIRSCMMKMVDPETVLIGTNVDRDDQMRKFTATLRPGIRAMTKGHQPGDILARLDFDPYYRSFQNVSTHIFAPELTEDAIRPALRERACLREPRLDVRPVGLFFRVDGRGTYRGQPKTGTTGHHGGRGEVRSGPKAGGRFPMTCHIRLLNGGKLFAETSGARAWSSRSTRRAFIASRAGSTSRANGAPGSILEIRSMCDELGNRLGHWHFARQVGIMWRFRNGQCEPRRTRAMSSAVVDIEVPVEETEAYQELMTRAGRRTGNIPADLMVRHVLACVPPHEWPTRVEAMDAVLRRLEAARKDSLRVEARPAEGRHLGLYVTRRPGSGSRPYRTILHGVDPIEGRCDCPDFVKNSLGICKHILVVLEHLHARPRVLQQAHKEQEWSDPQSGNGPVLGPDPAADRAWATGWTASSGKATSSPPRHGRRGSRRHSSGSARARTASRP